MKMKFVMDQDKPRAPGMLSVELTEAEQVFWDAVSKELDLGNLKNSMLHLGLWMLYQDALRSSWTCEDRAAARVELEKSIDHIRKL